jgi:hypothetical protein
MTTSCCQTTQLASLKRDGSTHASLILHGGNRCSRKDIRRHRKHPWHDLESTLRRPTVCANCHASLRQRNRCSHVWRVGLMCPTTQSTR